MAKNVLGTDQRHQSERHSGYYFFLKAGGFVAKGETSMITPEIWAQGHSCTLFLFDNTANFNADEPRQKGDSRLLLTLEPANATNVIV